MPEELTLLPCPACGASDVVMRVDTRAYGFCPACGMCGPCSPNGICDQAMERPAPSADVDARSTIGSMELVEG